MQILKQHQSRVKIQSESASLCIDQRYRSAGWLQPLTLSCELSGDMLCQHTTVWMLLCKQNQWDSMKTKLNYLAERLQKNSDYILSIQKSSSRNLPKSLGTVIVVLSCFISVISHIMHKCTSLPLCPSPSCWCIVNLSVQGHLYHTTYIIHTVITFTDQGTFCWVLFLLCHSTPSQ